MPRLAARVACGLWLAIAATGAAAAPALQHAAGRTMGTTWSLRWVPAGTVSADAVQRGVQAALDNVDGQMSTYRPMSALSRFNQAPAGTWEELPPELFAVLQRALELARASDGAYDPTVGPLVNLWGFGPDHRPPTAPSQEAIDAARTRVGWQRLRLDASTRRALQPGGLYVDLSSIAKGYGVDQAGALLERAGITHWLLEVGGELKAHGTKADGTPWRVGIELPDAALGPVVAADELVRAVPLVDQAIATSGDYRRTFTDGGREYSHHIDPRTGRPVPSEVASVSVLADDCVVADPLGTMLSVLGAARGMAYAEAHGLAVLMIVRTPDGFEQRLSPAFIRALGARAVEPGLLEH